MSTRSHVLLLLLAVDRRLLRKEIDTLPKNNRLFHREKITQLRFQELYLSASLSIPKSYSIERTYLLYNPAIVIQGDDVSKVVYFFTGSLKKVDQVSSLLYLPDAVRSALTYLPTLSVFTADSSNQASKQASNLSLMYLISRYLT